MRQDIAPELAHRFMPYLQLHEFDALLFIDINIIYSQIPPKDIINKSELEQTFSEYSNPEYINNNKNTSPSGRLHRIIKGYNKVIYGDILANAIGLQSIRAKAPRFNSWLAQLELV